MFATPPLPAPYDAVAVLNNAAIGSWTTERSKFLTACADWKEENIQNRTLGRPQTPKPVPPTHEVWFYDANNRPASHQVIDPTLQPPELPPLNEAGPGAPMTLTTGAHAEQDTQTILLGQVRTDVAKLLTHFGIS